VTSLVGGGGIGRGLLTLDAENRPTRCQHKARRNQEAEMLGIPGTSAFSLDIIKKRSELRRGWG